MKKGRGVFMKRLLAAFSVLLLLLSLFSFGSCSEQTVTKSVFAMNTYCTVTVPAKNADAADEIIRRVNALEALLSVSREGSDIYRLNYSDGEQTPIDNETALLLKRALELNSLLPAFDFSLFRLSLLWGFFDTPSVPDDADIKSALSHCGTDKLTVGDGFASLSGGAMVDLGAIAKGYAADEASKILLSHGVERALLNFGGNVFVLGTKQSGADYKVGIKKPYTEEILATLTGKDLFYVTSGSYERYFTEGGKNYCHIIDPKTGYPAESGLYSVTVVCEDGTLADVLSTAFFIMGAEASLDFINETHLCEAVFVTCGNGVIITDGLKDRFTLLSSDYALKD